MTLTQIMRQPEWKDTKQKRLILVTLWSLNSQGWVVPRSEVSLTTETTWKVDQPLGSTCRVSLLWKNTHSWKLFTREGSLPLFQSIQIATVSWCRSLRRTPWRQSKVWVPLRSVTTHSLTWSSDLQNTALFTVISMSSTWWLVIQKKSLLLISLRWLLLSIQTLNTTLREMLSAFRLFSLSGLAYNSKECLYWKTM